MYRHRKTDLFKKEELIPDSEKHDKNYHRVPEKEVASRKLRNSGLAHMEATCDKKTGFVKRNNGGSTVPNLEMCGHFSGARQRSNNSAFDGKADPVETFEGAPELFLSVKDEDATDTSTLMRWVETSTLSKFLNAPCPPTQHAGLGATTAKIKPSISLRRDPNILSKQTGAEEFVRIVKESTSVSKLRNSSLSTDRKSNILQKYNKENAQVCKKTSNVCNIPSTKSRSINDTSARASVQSKSLSRSRSPGPVIEQQRQQVNSKDRSRKEQTSENPKVNFPRKNQQLLKDTSRRSKSTHASVQFSQSKRDQRGDDDSKDATYRIDNWVTGADHVISDGSIENPNLIEDAEAKLRSQTSVASSMSDTYVCDPKNQRTQSIGRVKQNGTDQSKLEKRRDIPVGLIKKAKFVGKVDAHDKRNSGEHLFQCQTRGFSRESVKPETLTTVSTVNKGMNETCRHPPLCDSVVAAQQITRDRTGVSSVKWNASKHIANASVYNNNFKITVKREDELCNASIQENKQHIKGTARLAAKCHTSTSGQPSPLNNISETRDRKCAVFAKTKQRNDKREKEINDCENNGRSYKEDKKTDRVSTNTETQMRETSNESNISPKLFNLEELVRSDIFCPCSADDLINISRFRPDVTQSDILPVIYFCWQKCPNLQNEDEPTKPNLQQVVSLEQGLGIFKQMMKEVISENTLYSQEFTLNQLFPKGTKSLPNCEDKNNDDELIVAGTCFQLKPSYKTKSNQVILSSGSASSSNLQGLFNADGNNLSQENGQTVLLDKNGAKYQLHSAVGDMVCSNNDLQIAVNISKPIKNSIQRRLNMTSLWSFVSNGIIAFFLHPLERPSFAYSVLCGENKDSNGTNVDEINTFLDTGQILEVGAPQQRMSNDKVESSQHTILIVDQCPDFLSQNVTEEAELSCQNFVPVKIYSERKRTHSFETSSKYETESSSTNNTRMSKSVPLGNKKINVKDGVYLSLENSAVDSPYGESNDHLSRWTDQMEISKQKLQFSEHTSVFTNTHTPSNPEVKHRRLDKCREDVPLGENFKRNKRSKDHSPFIHSNKQILRGMHFEKTDRNEMNNIPFSTHVYQSLEGSQTTSDYDTVFGEKEDFAYRAFENDELEFVAPYEDCPDPGIEDLEKSTEFDLTVRLPGYCAANLKQFPHLVWTWRYGQSMLDSEAQPYSESKGSTYSESPELNDGNWKLYKTEESTHKDSHDHSVHFIHCKDYIQEHGVSGHDACVKGVKNSLRTESPHLDCCHKSLPQTHASLAHDIAPSGINAKASRQHVISSHIPHDVGRNDKSAVNVTDMYGNSNMCYIHDSNEGMTLSNNVTDARLIVYGSNCDPMETTTMLDNNIQNCRVTSPDRRAFNGLERRDISHRKDAFNKDIEENGDWIGGRASSAEGITGERSNHYISAIHSHNWKPAYTSDHKAAPVVNIPTTGSYLSDLATMNSNSDFEKDSNEVALLNNDKHEQSPERPATQDTRYKTPKKIDGTMVALGGCSSKKSDQVTSTDVDVNYIIEGPTPNSTTAKQSLQLFSTDNITRVALALKEAGTSHMTYLCNSQTASICSYLLRVGCSRPLGATLSNLIFTQQLARDRQRRMLDQCGSSVDDRELNSSSEDVVENHVSSEDTLKSALKDSLEHGKIDTGMWRSLFYVVNRARHDSENATTSIDSSHVGNEHKTEPEKKRKLSFTQVSNNVPEKVNSKGMNRNDEEKDTFERATSFGDPSRNKHPVSIRSNHFSNKSKREGNKRKASELTRITDNLNPNTCQSDECQESGIFIYSYYSLASPPVTQPTQIDNADSGSLA